MAPISPFVPEPDSFDQIPIIVPTAQLLSTMEDPSRGSQHTVNLPLGLQGLISGSSSDAPQATTAEDAMAATEPTPFADFFTPTADSFVGSLSG